MNIFARNICPKGNVIGQLKFKLTLKNVAIQLVTLYVHTKLSKSSCTPFKFHLGGLIPASSVPHV